METFQDQSHINQVRDALWARYGSGASVMVGSGFSKNAVNVIPDADGPSMLLDVAKEMHSQLYPNPSAVGAQPNGSETIVAERIPSLAQEFKTAFGRGNLHQLLQHMIRDDDLKPGEAHIRLLQLPWRDVFTTNWDTLLEKTRPHVMDRTYRVIRDMDEIPLAHKPRIVKLHGSLPAQFPLIITEEDYRKYPTRFAPFVNTVQQAMMETVFCLTGFSGNDPNFLSWSGWVRDNLGDSAPKIYLAGWLELPDHKRRMLERRRVVPIDLARHPRAYKWPEHLRHKYATEWVLHTLEQGRPYDVTYWPSPPSRPDEEIPEYLSPVVTVARRQPVEEPRSDEGGLEQEVKETLDIWSHNREIFPGWLALPQSEEREILKMRTDDWEPRVLASLPGFTVVERLNAVFELIWRREILLQPLSEELASAAEDSLRSVDCLERKINGSDEGGIDWNAVRKLWRNVALALVTAARFRFDRKLFNKRTELLEPFVNDHPDVYHRLRQERCLWAIYTLDFETLGHLIDDWVTKDCDPIWMIRKAALLWESDRNDEAANLVRIALGAIRSIPDAENSVAGSSREGWALWSVIKMDNRQEINRRWDELAALKCDAMLERDHIARRLKGNGKTQDAPRFDLGARPGASLTFSNERPDLASYRAIRLTEVAGLPPITNYGGPIGSTVASDILGSAAEEMASLQPEVAIRLVLRVAHSETDKTLERVLPRTRVATLSDSSVEDLSDICIGVINYASPRLVTPDGQGRSIPWITRMNVAVEVLSRLALRVTFEKGESILDLSLQCVQSPKVANEFELHKSLDNLLRRTWGVLPKERRAARAADLLSLPIPGVGNFTTDVADFFPDPAGFLQSHDLSLARTPDNDSQWSDAVSFLIRGLEGDVEARTRALPRILTIFEAGLLTESELSAVAQALWSERHTALNSLPAGTHLPDWVFLWLPEPDPGRAERLFRLKWLSGDIGKFKSITQGDSNTFTASLGTRPANPDALEDVFWNVGTAISALRHYGSPLQLTDDERKYVASLVEHWADVDFPSHPIHYFQSMARQSTVWALRGLKSILTEVVILQPVGDRLFEKFKSLTDSGTPSFELIHGLVMTIPDQFEELIIWLRMGLTSDQDALAGNALAGLHSWLTASIEMETASKPPPEDLLREVGFIIATRRRVSLPLALQVAAWVFEGGTPGYREAMRSLAVQGLGYLAEELRYDREHGSEDNIELPLLRLRCVQLAQSMAQSGFGDDPTVRLWLELGANDPLPEVRYAIDPSDDSGETEE